MKRYKPKKYRKKPKKNKLKVLKNKRLWILILTLLLIGIAFYFLTLHSFFQIKKITLSGNEKIKKENVIKIVESNLSSDILFFNTKSIFFVNFAKIEREIKKVLPRVKSITLKRDFPETIKINIKEKVPVGTCCLEDKCFYVNKQGIIFAKSEGVIGFKTNLNSVPELGEKVFDENLVSSLCLIKDKANIEIEKFILEEKITSITSEGWEIYFTQEKNIQDQIDNLNLILDENIHPEEYIDLRFEKIFYK